MKISKPAAAIAVAILILFVVAVLALHNREIARMEGAMIEQLRQEAEMKAKAEFDREREAFEVEREQHLKMAEVAGAAYSKKAQEAEHYRREAQQQRATNASLNTSWEQKFTICDRGRQADLSSWAALDKQRDKDHAAQVEQLQEAIEADNLRFGELTAEISGEYREGILVKPGYIQKVAGLEAALEIEKRKRRGWLIHGPSAMVFYRDGRIDGALGYGMTIKVGRVF
jgi:ATPase subunit of ABC transporter with duplicated ATPase domains